MQLTLRVARIGNDLLERQVDDVHEDALEDARKRNGSDGQSEMGSDPRFGSGGLCQAVRPLFS